MSALATRRWRAPDLIEPVIGFRQWKLRDGKLCSPFSQVIWDDAELHARCAIGTHDPDDMPAASCSCGVYAYYDQSPRTASVTADLVAGAVVLWGSLELHGGGMRAAHARVIGLVLPLWHGRKRREVIAAATRLEVPAVTFRRLSVIAGEHGAPLPRSLRPPYHQPPVGVRPCRYLPTG